MKKRVPCLCLIAIMMVAGCETPGPAVRLPNGGTLSIAKTDPNATYTTIGPPMAFIEDPLGSGIFVYKRYFKRFFVQEQGNSFRIQVGGKTINDRMRGVMLTGGNTIVIGDGTSFLLHNGGRTITVKAPPPPVILSPSSQTRVFTQPLTHQLWKEVQAGHWDITKMQLYISGTVALEQEIYATELLIRDKDELVEEIAQGPQHLRGESSTGEIITRSTYANTLRVLQTMTSGQALPVRENPEETYYPAQELSLAVCFEAGSVDDKFLWFKSLGRLAGIPVATDSYDYFYLDYRNGEKISYGGKPYTIKYDEKSGRPPYLMIRTEYDPSTDPKYLPGRPIPSSTWRAAS